MKRKMLFVLLVITIAVLAYLYTRPILPVLSIDKVYNVAETGQTVLLNVTLSNIPDCGNWLITFAWDPTTIQLTTGGPNSTSPLEGGPPVVLIEGPFMKAKGSTRFIISSADNTRGTAEVYSGLVGQSVSGSGVILMMNFTILKVGTTTVEIRPPSPTLNQSVIGDAQNRVVDHAEVHGLITEKGPPPIWAGSDFQYPMIAGEVIVLGAVTSVIYWRTHPRPPKSARRRAELQPTIEPEDQAEPN